MPPPGRPPWTAENHARYAAVVLDRLSEFERGTMMKDPMKESQALASVATAHALTALALYVTAGIEQK